MSRRLFLLFLIPIFLLNGGCGGSSHPSSSTTVTATDGVATRTTPPSRTSPGHSRGTASVPAGSGGATNVRVPATFAIHPGGRVLPPVISIPAFFAIELTVASADGHAHMVTFRGHVLRVPAGGRASTLIPGLKNGQYGLVVDGASRATVVIGGEPGP